MAPRRSSPGSTVPASPEVRALERISRVLALIATKGLNQTDRILFLKNAGFDIAETAEIAGITAHHVSVALHLAKKPKPKRQPGREPQK